ncbi:MAG: hypothetical protein DMF37_12620 [Verrucomicrobia bacterium]|nr:MAG: hypothetical protein DMF37_12620 [Verrucomicrobiota bacterium]
MAALALLPAAGEAIYFRDKISWRSPIAPSEMVTVEQARGWSDTAIYRWNELLPQFLAVWAPGKKIVVYCSSLSCNASREVARRLRKEAQLSDVFVLEGGWEAWLKKNR